MTSHISNVNFNVQGITMERCLGYLSSLNRPSTKTYLTKITSFIFYVFTSSNLCLRDVNRNVLQSKSHLS